MVDEFGFDASRDGPVEERGTYAFQANEVAFHLDVFATKPWLSGASYWIAAGLGRVARMGRRRPARGTRRSTRRGWSTSTATPSRRSAVVSQIYHATHQIAP